jgi:hypothetical protein
MFWVMVFSTPILAVVGLVAFIRILIGSTVRGLATDAFACIACWGWGSFVFGWIGQLGAGDNAPRSEMIAAGASYGVTCFVLGAALIIAIALFRWRLLSRGSPPASQQGTRG